MRRSRRVILSTVLLFMLYAAEAGAARISSITVEGNNRFSEEIIKTSFSLTPGDEIKVETLQAAVIRLFALNLFEDVKVLSYPDIGGTGLIIQVWEKPAAGKISVSGGKEFEESEYRDKLLLVEGQIIDYHEIHDAVTAIKDMYIEKGYLGVEVSESLTQSEDGEPIDIEIIIEEGEKVRISAVYISGNTHFSDDELERLMTNREKRFLSGGEFKENELEDDFSAIEHYYQDRGFLDVHVYDHSFSYKRNMKDLVLDIKLTEGPRYRVGRIAWSGNQILPDELMEQQIGLVPGDIFRQGDYEATLNAVSTYYYDRGYINLGLVPEKDFQGNEVAVNFAIEEGEQARINRILILGNTSTREYVIRRELLIYPFDVFNRSRLILSQQRIFNLSFFEDVQIEPVFSTEPGMLDLNLIIKEKFTGQFNIAVGYSALDRVTGIIGVGHPNLFGRGHQINFNWEFGKIKQNFQFSFTEPWLFDTPTSLGFDVYFLDRNRYTYTEKRVGGSVRVARPVPGVAFTKVYSTLKSEQVELDYADENNYLSLYYPEGKRLTNSATLSMIRDSRDNYFFATSGSRSELTMKFAGTMLGGDVSFLKTVAKTSWYSRTIGKFALMIYLEGGLLEPLAESTNVPLYERFEMGGTWLNPLRGYPDRSIGPSYEGGTVGGRALVKTSIELRYPIVENQVFGHLFFDAGNSWENMVDVDLNSLYRGFGAGIKLQVPGMGLIGLDMGYGLDRADGGGWEPHFQFGMSAF